MLHKDRVIIFRVIKHGESDLIINAINRQGARVGFYARGGAKSRKRFGGGTLEPTHYVEVDYRSRASGADEQPLHTLNEAKLIDGFEGLRSDYDRLQTALYFLSVVGKLSQEGAVDSTELFDLLGNTLRAAETSTSLSKLKLHFEVKLLSNQGVLPPLPTADEWLRLPIRDHGSFEIENSELFKLESHVRHHLDAYIGGLVADL